MTIRKAFAITTGVALAAALFATALRAAPRRGGPPKPQDVTLVGHLVDVQTHMTEKCPGEDFTKCARDNIRNGVPAAVITDDGLVIIGMGDKGPARLLIPLADQDVEIEGKLYDKDGLLYIDMKSAKVYKEEGEEEQPPHGEEGGEAPHEP